MQTADNSSLHPAQARQTRILQAQIDELKNWGHIAFVLYHTNSGQYAGKLTRFTQTLGDAELFASYDAAKAAAHQQPESESARCLENSLTQIVQCVVRDPDHAAQNTKSYFGQMSEAYKTELRKVVNHMSALVNQTDTTTFEAAGKIAAPSHERGVWEVRSLAGKRGGGIVVLRLEDGDQDQLPSTIDMDLLRASIPLQF